MIHEEFQSHIHTNRRNKHISLKIQHRTAILSMYWSVQHKTKCGREKISNLSKPSTNPCSNLKTTANQGGDSTFYCFSCYCFIFFTFTNDLSGNRKKQKQKQPSLVLGLRWALYLWLLLHVLSFLNVSHLFLNRSLTQYLWPAVRRKTWAKNSFHLDSLTSVRRWRFSIFTQL